MKTPCPPSWEAGAEYVWEALLAHVNAFFQHTPAVNFERVAREWLLELAGETFEEKLMCYERDLGERRKSKFVSFAQRRLAKRLTKLSRERWETTVSDAARVATVNVETRRRRREHLKAYLKQEDLTMTDLARRLAMSITAIQGMVRGDSKRYSQQKLEKLLRTIGVPLDQW